MEKRQEQTLYTESLIFTLQVEENSISSKELISYLTNLNKLLSSLNVSLNTKYALGFDQILLDVEALEKGSFRIPIKIRKILKNPYMQIVVASILGAIATNLISGNNSTITTYNNYDAPIEIKYEDLVENRETIKSVSNIAKTTIESQGIRSISIEYETPDNKLERVDIQKNVLKDLIVDDIEEINKDSSMLFNTHLVIVSPVLEKEEALWKVRCGDRKFSARMTDTDFIGLMSKNKIAFGFGDVIIADLETIVSIKSDNTPDIKHYIRKVHQYPQYTTKSNESDQNLF